MNRRETVKRKRCPCEFPEIEPCTKQCTCRTPHYSGGCSRCATYGSYEQQLSAARRLAGIELQLSEEQKKADGYLAVLGAIRAVLILDQGDKMPPELRKAMWLDHDVAMDLQRARREVVEAAREWKTKEQWPYLNASRLAYALDAVEKIEAARVEKGLPLETRIVEKRDSEDCPLCRRSIHPGTTCVTLPVRE